MTMLPNFLKGPCCHSQMTASGRPIDWFHCDILPMPRRSHFTPLFAPPSQARPLLQSPDNTPCFPILFAPNVRIYRFITVISGPPNPVGEMANYTDTRRVSDAPKRQHFFDSELTWQLAHWQNAPMIPCTATFFGIR